MISKLEKLLFSVSLIDKVSGPVGKIMRNVDRMTRHTSSGFLKLGIGIAGIAGAGRLLGGLLNPIKDMMSALGEVRSLGVTETVLKNLQNTALRSSIKFGENAAAFARASYDIQSAIGGLEGNQLAKFTNASAVLAKATKSNVATITDYMGTMYSVFEKTAIKMGKSNWVEMVAGQTAKAVEIFKTTGSKMAESFSNLGEMATVSGVSMANQMAIMGTLGASMSGSEAATKYKAFLAGAGKAQKALGLQFTDSHGRLLPMLEVLAKIRGKYGALDTLAEKGAIHKAFGSKEALALILSLSGKTTNLKNSMEELSNIKGMENATLMALQMTNSWERMSSGFTAIKTRIGEQLMVVLNPLMNMVADFTDKLVRWSTMFPNVTRVIGFATLGVIALIAAVGALTMLGGTLLLFKGLWIAVAFSAGMVFTPVMGIIAAVVALGVGAVWLYKNWDTAMTFMGNKFSSLRKMIESNFITNFLYTPLLAVVDAVGWVIDNFDKIKQWFIDFKPWLKMLNPFGLLTSGVSIVLEKLGVIGGGNVNMPAPPNLTSNKTSRVAAGGLLSQITNATSNNNSGARIGKVEIHAQHVDAVSLADHLALAAG